MRIDQIAPSIDCGDAVSNDMLSICRELRSAGYESDIYAKYVNPQLCALVKGLEEYKGGPGGIVLYHYSLGVEEVSDFVKKLPGKKVLVYHNITPPAFLQKYDADIALKCARGLGDLKSFPRYFCAAIGMSDFSRQELEQIGFRDTYELPILIDTRALGSKVARPTGDGVVRILFTGRVSPNKKLEDIIKTFYYYHSFINEKSQLVLAGKWQMPAYLDELKALVSDLRLGDSVLFTGEVDDARLAWYYSHADVFLCMSEHEGFCVPLVEAMHYGIPIIAYSAAAVPGTLKDSGVLILKKDHKKVAEIVDLVVCDEGLRKRLIDKQDERLKELDISVTVQKLYGILEEIANKPAVRQLDNCQPRRSGQTGVVDPFVSVIICTYNRGPHLKRCLESLYHLDYVNFEIIVVNGPSSDNTKAILSEYPDVRVVDQKKLNGLSFARNLGIKAACGDIVAFIDDDAVAHRSWLTSLVSSYKDPGVGGAGGPVFDLTGQWYQFRNGYVSKNATATFHSELDHDYNDPRGPVYNYIMGANASFRRDVLDAVGMFDENIRYYLDETDVCVRVIMAGHRIVHNSTAIVYHEMAEGHNRRSQYDVNYREIMKNIVYFTIKNFRKDLTSYTLRPLASLKKWLFDDVHFLRTGKVTPSQFLRILIKLATGTLDGYLAGLKYAYNHR